MQRRYRPERAKLLVTPGSGPTEPRLLSPADRRHFGAPPGWNCRDVKFFIGRIAFEQLGAERAAALNAVETNFKLPPDQVDMLITAGRDALKGSTVFRSFLDSLGETSPRGVPVASPVTSPQEARAQ